MILIIHFSASLFMTGVIWLVQVVHYPSFKWISRDTFPAYTHFHQKRISWIVLPVMIVELTAAVLQVLTIGGRLSLLALILTLLIWISTFLLQVPLHRKLELGWNQPVMRSLVWTNWLRTILWTLKSSVLLMQIESIHLSL